MEKLYKQIIYWLAEPEREDWHDLIKKFVTPEIIEGVDYRKIFECLTGSRDILEHGLNENQVQILASSMLIDNYKPLNEKQLISHLKELQRAKNREKIGGLLIEAQKELERGDGVGIASKFNEIKKLETVSSGKSIKAVMQEINSETQVPYPKTGIRLFDDCIGGFRQGHIWIIGAYSGAGKTQMLTKLAYNAGRQGAEVLFLTMEMDSKEIVKRMNWLDKNENRIGVYDLPIIIDDKAKTLSDIEILIRRHAPQVVFVDFIQLVRNGEKSEYEQMTKNAVELQRMAHEHNVCMVCSSQFSNDFAKMQSLQTVNYKGSGAIAQVADAGIILHRNFDEEDKNGADIAPLYIYLRKNRHGKGGKAKIEFNTTNGLIIDRDFTL